MYKITTQERLLQNLVNEYEKFGDPRLVSLLVYVLTKACMFKESWQVDRNVLYDYGPWRSWPILCKTSIRLRPRSLQNQPE
jgi:hypothetical protein